MKTVSQQTVSQSTCIRSLFPREEFIFLQNASRLLARSDRLFCLFIDLVSTISIGILSSAAESFSETMIKANSMLETGAEW